MLHTHLLTIVLATIAAQPQTFEGVVLFIGILVVGQRFALWLLKGNRRPRR